jgi:hypothetical protein
MCNNILKIEYVEYNRRDQKEVRPLTQADPPGGPRGIRSLPSFLASANEVILLRSILNWCEPIDDDLMFLMTLLVILACNRSIPSLIAEEIRPK